MLKEEWIEIGKDQIHIDHYVCNNGKEKEFLLLQQWHCLLKMVQAYWGAC